jgi:tetratricopeptide (TPR) repeat protein
MTSQLKIRQAMQQRHYKQAVGLLTDALKLDSGDLQAHWLMVQCLVQLGRKDKAMEQARALLDHARKDLAAIDALADFLLKSSLPLAPVLDAYRRYLVDHPGSANAAFNCAYYLAKDAQFEAAVDTYRLALELGVKNPEEAHLNMANILMDHLHQDTSAQDAFRAALAINPRYAAAHYNLGNLFEQRGDREQAIASFEKCLELEPGNETALARIADSHRFGSEDDPLLKRLTLAIKKSEGSDLCFALGRAHEQIGNFDLAWRHFTRANQIDGKNLPPYRPEQTETLFREIASQCSADWISRVEGSSHEPVFICGMFRTGSTLLERVLGAHASFVSGGESEFFPRLVARELPAYPDGLNTIADDQPPIWRKQHAEYAATLTGGARRLTDKRPDNFLYIGLIKAVLPSAKFIVTERDWRDVATSIFCTRLGMKQNYATTLKHIRHYIELQKQLVDHWHSVLGPGLIRVQYEELVKKPREVIGRLLEDLGEDWDDRCLQFDKLGGTVSTASVWQVRQPIHSRSIGRWSRYRSAFIEAFGEGFDD